MSGVISIPHGWDEVNANVLTDDRNLDPVTGFPANRCFLARIVKKDKIDGIDEMLMMPCAE